MVPAPCFIARKNQLFLELGRLKKLGWLMGWFRWVSGETFGPILNHKMVGPLLGPRCLQKDGKQLCQKRMKPSRPAESFAIGKCTSSQVFSESAWMHRSTVGLKRCGHHTLELPPTQKQSPPGFFTFLVGNPYKPSFVTVTGLGVDGDHTIDGQNPHLGCGNSCILPINFCQILSISTFVTFHVSWELHSFE